MISTNKRNSIILKMYKDGLTLENIARNFHFTRSRAQQIVINEFKKEIIKEYNLESLSHEEQLALNMAAKEEMKEVVKKKKEIAILSNIERIKNKMKSVPHYIMFYSLSSYAKSLNEKVDDIKKFFPEITNNITTRQKNKWSHYYNKCRSCGTTAIKHTAHGYCENCYTKTDLFKDVAEASRLRNKEKWKDRLREYAREYGKRPNVIEKRRKILDQKQFGGNRKNAIKRDHYKCSICAITQEESFKKLGRDLYVVHINNKKDNRLENLMTICQKCHNQKVMRLMREKLKLIKRKQ